MAKVPSRVVELIETFDRNIETYRSQKYNETQLRREFIDPFFEELGWDVTNRAGHAQAYKDVIHEDAIKIGGYTKAPDYCFRIGGTRKFFLEAKKPSVDIKADVHPAYQLRRYAWSAKLPLSILTDFEEFAVYDCQARPKQSDKASAARIKYLTYKEYINKWDEIADIFSKDAILKGSFDKFAVSTKGKRGTTTVDKEFLSELEKWRSELARIISLRNRKLSQSEINFSVQRTIDRILFLRMCEDRGIEDYGQLLKISTGNRTYPRLCEIFEKADHKYNSGLFYFRKEAGRPESPDELTPNLIVDDNTLKYMLHSLYYPQCPYEFSVLPAEILGNVYEQFLGKVIELTPAHRAEVKEKPEVKKAGGIYYTPSYIVDYIVKNTVGKLCEGKTPKDISKLRILDPACGSGSFLLGAYTYLLNYHRDWYVDNNPEKYTKKIYQGKGAQWFLTIAEKKKILLNSIFGVDIDSQAVEVTKLSLLLKVLEGETSETVGQTYKMFHERALPDLGNNIKCGNSLIGPDFYDDKDPNSNGEEQRRKINAFNYKTEFPHIFKTKNPGFDTVIGNPPWIFTKYVDWGKDTKKYIQKIYLVGREKSGRSRARQAGKINLFAIFFLKGLSLLNSRGCLGVILPNNILRTTVYDVVRKQILDSYKLRRIVDLKSGVFPHVTASTVILLIDAEPADEHYPIQIVDNKTLGTIQEEITNTILQMECLNNPSYVFDIFTDSTLKPIIDKVTEVSLQLGTLVEVRNGIATYVNMEGVLEKPQDSNSKPILFGKDIARYHFTYSGKYINYVRQKLLRPRNEAIFLSPEKLVMQRIGGILVTAYDDRQYYTFNSVNNILLKTGSKYSLKYILGIIDSKLMRLYYITKFTNRSSLTVNISKTFLDKIPICTIDFGNPTDKAKHDKMVKLVDRMLDLHKNLAAAKVPGEKTRIQRQINTTDKKIDKLTYDLYDLTEEDISLVEQNQ
ncbi:MAG: N-6 DNA methylase [Planctomycetes bacterium]|nr:N-6 DNA methylase [Planctomycetota bacterium]